MSSKLIRRVQEEYYTLGETAQACSVSTVTVWRWIKAGKIEAHNLGREVLIEKRIIDTLKHDREVA